MLPDGFEWRHYIDGPALYWGEEQIASITPLANGKFRICLNPHSMAIRYEFFDSLRECELYVELWARKWEGRLRGG